MTKDFDQARAERPGGAASDRTFTLGGRTFRFRAGIEPEAYAEYADWLSVPLVEEVGIVEHALSKAGLVGGDAPASEDQARDARRLESAWAKISSIYVQQALYGKQWTAADTLDLLNRTVEAWLVPDDRPAWAELRKPGELEPPLAQLDLVAIINHMVEVTTARPTGPSSDSGSGGGTTGTTSTQGSRSPEGASSQA